MSFNALDVRKSWHVPMTKSNTTWRSKYRSYHDNDEPARRIPIIFRTRMTSEEENVIVDRISQGEQRWYSAPKHRALRHCLWLHDHSLSYSDVLVFLHNCHPDLSSSDAKKKGQDHKTSTIYTAILVSTADTAIVVATRRVDKAFSLAATTVRSDLALSLAALPFDTLEEFREVLGTEFFDVSDSFKLSHFEIPAARNPYVLDAGFSLNHITIIPLVDLGDRESNLRDSIDPEHTTDIRFLPTQSVRTRDELYLLFDAIEGSSELGHIFFIDNILPDDTIIACHRESERQMTLMPVYDKHLIEFWQTVKREPRSPLPLSKEESSWTSPKKSLKADEDTEIKFCDLMAVERVHDPHKILDTNDNTACTIWLLRNFTLAQERRMREVLAKRNIAEDVEDRHEFTYIRTEVRTLEELVAWWATRDPLSPSYNPDCVPMNGYPEHFLAVDDELLTDEPVLLWQSHQGTDPDLSSDMLGWETLYLDSIRAYWIYKAFLAGDCDMEELAGENNLQNDILWAPDLEAYKLQREEEIRQERRAEQLRSVRR